MRYFNYINKPDSIFYKKPCPFSLNSDKELLSHALGATIYMGADRNNLLKDILSVSACSVVICLEDSVASDKLEQAEKNVLDFFKDLDKISKHCKDFLDNIPLIFVRLRNFNQLVTLLKNSHLVGLCGFIIPKFRATSGEQYFSTIKSYNILNSRKLYVLPILETPEVIFKTSRIEELISIKNILNTYKDLVLNIRIGGTDFSGIYSLRRGRDFTIYDLAVIKDCILDILNIFQIDGYVISAPVNEHFNFNTDLDNSGFFREILLDKLNGLVGKTVIHPTQIDIVNSLMVVSKEEYLDAEAIMNSLSDGAIKSTYKNKMNEVKPHFKWAYKTILLSKIMGVLNYGKTYKDILELSSKSNYMPEPKDIIEYIRNKV
ncbi:HpcH/HpaI aldolase/citrate lyase family protein [Clostridium lundense]|uniref:HpcH/HpaI aldolase/citrate lyase family protein n=1 Tax=Clostridium lundense TaxID=319475 RepID=UPI000687A45B|nr:HpcH/HpaI aldolase/citrate lyase family protein [Clostridium lundense]